ncbi:MAG: TonB-dependent receptor [Campylobacterota bacterium]
MTKTLLSLAATAAVASSLFAANQYTLEDISVTAAQGTELNKKDVTDSVTVITKEAIEESRVTTIEQALSRLGNLSVSSNGGFGQPASVFVRGMDSKRTLVLIDGVRYNDVTGLSGAQYPQIPLTNVEQIEIIKGAQSGIWGADASAGVINIVTSKAKKGLHASADIEYGSFDTKKTSLQASYAADTFDVLMGGSYFGSDGFSAAEPIQASPDYGKRYDELGWEKDAYRNKSFNAKFGWNITEGDRIEASVQAINSYIEYDAAAGVDADNVDDPFGWGDSNYFTNIKNRFYSLAYKHKDDLNDVTLAYNLSTFDRDQYGGYTGSVSEIKADDKITYMENSFFRIGGSHQTFEQKKSAGADLDKSYSALSAFASNYNKLNLFGDLNTIITESVRYDRYSEFDDKVTGKIGLKQYLFSDIFFSANIGTGYNVPTLYQLYDGWAGNLGLKPESTLSYEATLGNEMFWVTGFYNKVTDLIDYDFATFAFSNIEGDSILKGLEAGYQDYFFDTVGAKVLYTYLDAENADGQTLARRPQYQLDAAVTYYATESFDLGVNALHIGTRYDGVDKTGAQTGEYVIVNFVSNVKVNDNISVYGKVDNITDKYYQMVDGYATAGRSLYVGLTATY